VLPLSLHCPATQQGSSNTFHEEGACAFEAAGRAGTSDDDARGRLQSRVTVGEVRAKFEGGCGGKGTAAWMGGGGGGGGSTAAWMGGGGGGGGNAAAPRMRGL
jgi:hypothetical protein